MDFPSGAVHVSTASHLSGWVLIRKLIILSVSTLFAMCTLAVIEFNFDLQTTSFVTVVPGDFNGDGTADALMLPNDNDTTAFITYNAQSKFLQSQVVIGPIDGLNQALSSQHFRPLVADLNGDLRSDLILQSVHRGHVATLIATEVGELDHLHEIVDRGTHSINWSYASTRLVTGDFNGDNRDDVLAQPRHDSEEGVLAWTDKRGDFGQASAIQTIPVNYLDLQWSDQHVELLVGNFNGQDSDGGYRDDILLRVLNPQTQQPHAVVLAHTDGELSQLADSWDDESEVPWGDSKYRALVTDFDRDGRDDVLLRSYQDGSGVLVISQSDTLFSHGTGLKLSRAEVDKRLTQTSNVRQFSNDQLYQMKAMAEKTTDFQSDIQAKDAPPNKALPTEYVVGAMQGGLSVNNGVANYTIPLVVPPGRNSMQPQLALGYSHTGGNGHVGMGWQLSGQSSIMRCSATAATDSEYATQLLGGVTLTTKDRFCLDGQHLKVVAGSYGLNGSEYRTEIDTFAKIVPNFTGLTLTSFTVYTRNSLEMTFGGTTDSRLLAHQNEMPLEWKLSSVKDKFSNEIRYTYIVREATVPGYVGNKPVEHYLDQITYTHHTGNTDIRKVKFNYSDRPDQRDYFRAGSQMVMTKRLDSVEMFLDATQAQSGTRVREYSLVYEIGATRRSRLTAISECTFGGKNPAGGDAGTQCLPPTTFSWEGDAYVNYNDSYKATPDTIQSFYQDSQSTEDFGYDKVPVDFDGDGRVDFIDLQEETGSSDTELVMWLNAQSGLKKQTYVLANTAIDPNVLRSNYGVLDYDANGKIDYLVPMGEPQNLLAPTNVMTAPILGGMVEAGTDLTTSWGQVAGSVDHYEMRTLKTDSGGNNGVWQTGVETAPGDTFQMIDRFGIHKVGNYYRFAVRACETANSSYCGGYATGPHFQVCDSDGNCTGNGQQSPVVESGCGAPTANPTSYLSIVSFNSDSNPVSANVTELSNIPVNPVAYNQGAVPVSYDANSYFAMDVNGDGRKDIVTRDVDQWYVFLRTTAVAPGNALYSYAPGSCLFAAQDRHVQVINYDGDGRQDLLVERPGSLKSQLFVYRSTGSGFDVIDIGVNGSFVAQSFVSGYQIAQPNVRPIVADVNGDGLSDIFVARDNGSTYSATRGNVHLYLNSGDGFITSAADTLTPIPSPGTHVAGDGLRLGNYISITDADGDGDLDLFVPDQKIVEGYGPCVTIEDELICSGLPELVSLNDGYSWKIAYYQNGGFTAPVTCSGACIEMTLRAGSSVDIDSNGRFEYVAEKNRTTADQVDPELNPYLLSFGGDSAPDLMTKVIEGDGGLNREVEIVYEPLQANSASGVYIYDPSTSPDGLTVDIAGTMHVVQSIKYDNGADNTPNRVSYIYEDARYDKTGRGFVGFGAVTEIDEEHLLANKTEFHQAFPFIGLPKKQFVYTVDNGQLSTNLLSKATYTWDTLCTNQPCVDPRVRYPKLVITELFDPVSFAKLSESRAHTASIDRYGNTLSSHFDQLNVNGVIAHRVQTVTAFDTDETNWWVNNATQTTTSYTAYDQDNGTPSITSSYTQSTSLNFNDDSRTLTNMQREPGDSQKAQATGFQYTPAGQVTHVFTQHGTNVTDADFQAPTQHQHISYTGGNKPYFPSGFRVRDNSTYADSATFSAAHGRMQSFTDVNNESGTANVSHDFDGFGRIVRTVPNDQPPIQYTYVWNASPSYCPDQSAYQVVKTQAKNPTTAVCYDRLNRPVLYLNREFDGGNSYVDLEYDRRGRVTRIDEPDAYPDASINGETLIDYDYIGRPKLVNQPDGVSVGYAYSNFVITTTTTGDTARPCIIAGTNCVIVTSTERNTLGQVISSIDAHGKVTHFKYDAFGNVVSITDPVGNEINHTYDNLNRLTTTDDPNMGFMSYQYDALGQLKLSKHHQSPGSNEGRTMRFTYDSLGRTYTRHESQAADRSDEVEVGRWIFDRLPDELTTAKPYIDQLTKVRGWGTLQDYYDQDYFTQSYDYSGAEGRLTAVTTELKHPTQTDQVFTQSYDYYPSGSSDHGKLQKTTYTGGVAIDYSYNDWGYLAQERSGDVGLGANALLREILGRNNRGQITSQQFAPASGGNAMVQSFDYVKETGQLQNICTTLNDDCSSGFISSQLQHITQSFDALSMPQVKHDQRQGITQNIVARDALGRLKQINTTGQNAQTFSYDDTGNFLNKSDWGTYQYAPPTGPRPYQVKTVTQGTDTLTYTHDVYGNMDSVTGTGAASAHTRSTDYTFANKPSLITKGNVTTQFKYGPDQQRYKQVTTTAGGDTVTTYYAGNSERVITTKAGGSVEQQTRHYVGDYLIHTVMDQVADSDGDGYPDTQDNCREHAINNQVDSDNDGYGNRCDPDFNNDGIVNNGDLAEFGAAFNALYDSEFDLNSDGSVNFGDYVIVVAFYLKSPGPRAQVTTANRFLLKDELGSVNTVVDELGNALARNRFDAFGKRINTFNDNSGTDTIGYTGHEHLDQTGLIHMNGRLYDPDLGRFTSVDPIIGSLGNSQSYSGYSYVNNMPFVYTDPSGYAACGRTDKSAPCKLIDYNVGQWLSDVHTAALILNLSQAVQNVIEPFTIDEFTPGGQSGTGPLTPNSVITVTNLPQTDGAENRGQVILINGGDNRNLIAQNNKSGNPNGLTGLTGGPENNVTLDFGLEGTCGYKGTCPKPPKPLPHWVVNVGEFLDYLNRPATITGPNGDELEVYSGSPPIPGLGGRVSRLSKVPKTSFSGTLVPYFPPSNGFLGAVTRKVLPPGQIIDRFGGSKFSRFFSPRGTPATARSLPPGTANQPLRQFEVLKPLPVEAGQVAPWFNQTGLGTQFRSGKTLGELLEQGFLREVTP